MENQRVLKAYSLREPGQKVVFDFEDFQKQLGDHLTEARQEAEQCLHQAQHAAGTLLESRGGKDFMRAMRRGCKRRRSR